MSDVRLNTGQVSLLVTPVDTNGNVIGGAGTIVLGTFKAINAGTGYSINDIIILRQTSPSALQYYNATTNTVIGTPLPADLGSVSASSNVSVVSALPTGANTIGAISNTVFTANAGTNLNTSTLAVESGGNLAGINTKVPSGLTVTSTRLLTDSSGVTQPVSAASLPLPTGASTSALQSIGNASLTSIDATQLAISAKLPSVLGSTTSANSLSVAIATDSAVIGAVTETAPANDTASSGLNGRLQRIAQRLTSLISLFPSSLGIKASNASLSVALSSASNATLSDVASSATSVTLIELNAARRTLIITNESTAILYIKLTNGAASLTSYSIVLAAISGGVPSTVIIKGDDYSGEIRGIWASANGFARITEIV